MASEVIITSQWHCMTNVPNKQVVTARSVASADDPAHASTSHIADYYHGSLRVSAVKTPAFCVEM